MTKVGQTVMHKILGEGIIEAEEGKYLRIRFGASQKTFVYPDAFASFLTASDPDFAAEAAADLQGAEEEKARRLEKQREEAKYLRRGVVIPGKGIRPEDEGVLDYPDVADEDSV